MGGDGVEQLVELQMPRVRIGRGRDNDIVLPDAEKGVSRVHAELRLENGRHVIVDLQSQNGTWVNGRRVDRAEVPVGAEIAVGGYRLTLLDSRGVAPIAPRPRPPVDPLDDMFATELREPPPFRGAPPAQTAAATASSRGMFLGAAVLALGAGLAAVVWMSASKATPVTAGTVAQPAAAQPAGDAPEAPAPPVPPAAEPERPEPAGPVEPAPRRSDGVAAVAPRPGGGPIITRRPGESTEAWRSREAALQTRYGYSKAALDRGDYAAAAGGFEAILLEEPGFLDAPRLLVQAQAGLRASARGLFDAAARLDEAGDWTGALRKYEQARQVYAGLPGLGDRIARARAKLRAAGAAAFEQARQHEAAGRVQDALREYEKAVQWLPAEDPNRQAARTRIEHLKKDD